MARTEGVEDKQAKAVGRKKIFTFTSEVAYLFVNGIQFVEGKYQTKDEAVAKYLRTVQGVSEV